MGFNANIPLSAVAPPYDPLATAMKIAQLRALRQEGQTRDLANQEAQFKLADLVRQQNEQQAVRQAAQGAVTPAQSSSYQEPTISLGGMSLPGKTVGVSTPPSFNRDQFLSNLTQSNPLAAESMRSQFAAQQQAQQEKALEIQKQLSGLRTDQLTQAKTELEISGRAFQSLKGLPEDQQQQMYPQVVNGLVQRGIIHPGQVPEQHPGAAGLDSLISQGMTLEQAIGNEMKNRQFTEEQRHNQATEKNTAGMLNERMRHDRVMEAKSPAQGGGDGDVPLIDPKLQPNRFRIAQDLAYGKLNFQAFRSIYAYSRDAQAKQSLYATAAALNPNFNPSQFEMGFNLAKNPKVQQQLASLDNVIQAAPDLIGISNQASRTGIKSLNAIIQKGGIQIGNQKYSNLHTAQIAFADELSGALGYGSATDMSREMGFNMTDSNLSPQAFASAINNVVLPFVQRKRATLLNQMGVYGQPNMNPAANAPKPGEQNVRRYNPATGKLE